MDIKVYCLNVVHVIIECGLRKINWFRIQRSLYEYNSKEWSPKLLGLSLYICKEAMTATPLPVSQESSHAWPIVSLQNKHAAWVDARAHVCQWHGKLQGSVLCGTGLTCGPWDLVKWRPTEGRGWRLSWVVRITHLDEGILVKSTKMILAGERSGQEDIAWEMYRTLWP